MLIQQGWHRRLAEWRSANGFKNISWWHSVISWNATPWSYIVVKMPFRQMVFDKKILLNSCMFLHVSRSEKKIILKSKKISKLLKIRKTRTKCGNIWRLPPNLFKPIFFCFSFSFLLRGHFHVRKFLAKPPATATVVALFVLDLVTSGKEPLLKGEGSVPLTSLY